MKIHVNIWKDILQKKLFILWKKTVEKFSYCPLHLMIVYQTRESVKGKKDEVALKDEDVPVFLEKKLNQLKSINT